MILKVNSDGIFVDVSFSQDAIESLDAVLAVIPKSSIELFKLMPSNENEDIDEKILLRDLAGYEYDVNWKNIVSINEKSGYLNLTENGISLNLETELNSNIEVFKYISQMLFGLQ